MSMDLSPYLAGRLFDAEATHNISGAFQAVMDALPATGQHGLVRELVAKRIIDIAGKGEREPEHIARRALEQFGFPQQK
jgi:hypothetical protein